MSIDTVRRALAATVTIACALLLSMPDVQAADAQDRKLRSEVQAILGAVDGLAKVRAAAEAGVVTLSGEVAAQDDAERAAEMVKAVDGVVAVNDRIQVNRSVDAQLSPVMDRFWSRVQDLLSLLPLLLVAATALLIFALLARAVSNWEAPFERLVANPFLRSLTRSVVAAGVFFVGLLIALEILDATALLGAVLGSAGVLGLALGFAMRDTIENYIAAVLLSLRQPFAPHDHIALEGFEGQVIRLTSRATILLTFDGNHVRIPNSTVFKSTMVNFTRNKLRRFQFEVGVDSAVDLLAAQALAVDTLRAMKSVLDDPEPGAFVTSLGDSNVVILIQGWLDQEHSSYAKVNSEAIRLVKEAFDAADYEMPEPIYRLRIRNDNGDAQLIPEIADAPQAAEQGPTLAVASAGAAQPASRQECDTSADDDLRRQVVREREHDNADDLLSADAPRE